MSGQVRRRPIGQARHDDDPPFRSEAPSIGSLNSTPIKRTQTYERSSHPEALAVRYAKCLLAAGARVDVALPERRGQLSREDGTQLGIAVRAHRHQIRILNDPNINLAALTGHGTLPLSCLSAGRHRPTDAPILPSLTHTPTGLAGHLVPGPVDNRGRVHVAAQLPGPGSDAAADWSRAVAGSRGHPMTYEFADICEGSRQGLLCTVLAERVALQHTTGTTEPGIPAGPRLGSDRQPVRNRQQGRHAGLASEEGCPTPRRRNWSCPTTPWRAG